MDGVHDDLAVKPLTQFPVTLKEEVSYPFRAMIFRTKVFMKERGAGGSKSTQTQIFEISNQKFIIFYRIFKPFSFSLFSTILQHSAKAKILPKCKQESS